MKSLREILHPLVQQSSVLAVRKATAPLSVVASKFGGVPYHEAGESWPICTACGKPLSFICQLDLRQTVDPARERIPFFTFFYCWGCFPWGTPNDVPGAWVVRTYRTPEEGKAVAIAPPSSVNHASECAVTFVESQSLPDWGGICRVQSDAMDLACELNEEAPWEAYREAAEGFVGERKMTSRVGGYPNWIQNDDTPNDATFLAQIDSEEHAGIMWGDAGMVYLFLGKEPGNKIDIILQCC